MVLKKVMISRYIKTTLSIWLLFLGFSFAVFSYLAYHPQTILVVEALQPGASYDRAKVSLSNGNIEDALNSYQRGVKYFKQLYQESGEDRHKIFISQGLLGIAHIYKNVANPPRLIEADAYYVEALGWHSDWNLAQPYYSLGETRYKAQKYADAIKPLTSAINKGMAPITLEALYLRGLSYTHLKQYGRAAKDWYQYLRFQSAPIPTERWNQMLNLRDIDIETPESIYILGRERFAREEPEEALQLFDRRIALNQSDISTQYYASVLKNNAIDAGFGERSLSSIFPPSDSGDEVRLWERYIDVYAAQAIEATISVAMLFRGTTSNPQRIQFELNGADFFEIIEKNAAINIYEISCSFSPGKSVILIREVDPFNQIDGSGVFLRSITINSQN
ncbi:MAG: tetratricopeptide repeat protein [Candidatus Hinthialibacter antarcticus]|nr:tetratricopeptide repeat protein [Candidatus Hinthialibacter antarcticus]